MNRGSAAVVLPQHFPGPLQAALVQARMARLVGRQLRISEKGHDMEIKNSAAVVTGGASGLGASSPITCGRSVARHDGVPLRDALPDRHRWHGDGLPWTR